MLYISLEQCFRKLAFLENVFRELRMTLREATHFLQKEAYYCDALCGMSDYNICINSDMTISCNCVDIDGHFRAAPFPQPCKAKSPSALNHERSSTPWLVLDSKQPVWRMANPGLRIEQVTCRRIDVLPVVVDIT